MLKAGDITPLPRTDFELADAGRAFRHMAQARHVGKIVLVPRLPAYEAPTTLAQRLFAGDATYLISGGLGGFGLATAQWMVENGARHLVLVGRGGVRPANRTAYEALIATGASVTALACDVSDASDLARALERIERRLPRLAGVVHAAMVLEWPRTP